MAANQNLKARKARLIAENEELRNAAESELAELQPALMWVERGREVMESASGWWEQLSPILDIFMGKKWTAAGKIISNSLNGRRFDPDFE
jgi:hypothetical protein